LSDAEMKNKSKTAKIRSPSQSRSKKLEKHSMGHITPVGYNIYNVYNVLIIQWLE